MRFTLEGHGHFKPLIYTSISAHCTPTECQVAAFTFVQGPFTAPLQVVSGEDGKTLMFVDFRKIKIDQSGFPFQLLLHLQQI